jgi:hypothetical protein
VVAFETVVGWATLTQVVVPAVGWAHGRLTDDEKQACVQALQEAFEQANPELKRGPTKKAAKELASSQTRPPARAEIEPIDLTLTDSEVAQELEAIDRDLEAAEVDRTSVIAGVLHHRRAAAGRMAQLRHRWSDEVGTRLADLAARKLDGSQSKTAANWRLAVGEENVRNLRTWGSIVGDAFHWRLLQKGAMRDRVIAMNALDDRRVAIAAADELITTRLLLRRGFLAVGVLLVGDVGLAAWLLIDHTG